MNYQARLNSAVALYAKGQKKVSTTPQPKLQKFSNGSRVKISDVLGEHMSHFESGVEAEVQYTYAHAYGGGDVESYSLKFDDGSTSSWYEEWQLTAV